MPTYKYDLRSPEFDTSKKQRVPAFCDRVLWRRNAYLEQLWYGSVPNVDFSDHRPVVAHFELLVEPKERVQTAARKPAFVDYLQDKYKQLKKKPAEKVAQEQISSNSIIKDMAGIVRGEEQLAFGLRQQNSRIVTGEQSDDDDEVMDPVNDEFEGLEGLDDDDDDELDNVEEAKQQSHNI